MDNIQKLREEAEKYKPQIVRIKDAFRKIAAKADVDDEIVLSVMVKKGYIVYMPRAKRYTFTEEGKRFYKGMKRFG